MKSPERFATNLLLGFFLGLFGAAAGLLAQPATQPSNPPTSSDGGEESSPAPESSPAELEGELSAFDVQVLLDRVGISPGVIDGLWGDNTRGALKQFQRSRGLEVTGEPDAETTEALRVGAGATVTEHVLTEDDLAGPFLEGMPEEASEKAQLERLAYLSVEEKLAERWHTLPEKLAELNPDAEMKPGTRLRVPAIESSEEGAGAASSTPEGEKEASVLRLVVSESEFSLRLVDGEDRVHFYAPVTAGSTEYPLPRGEFEVTTVVTEPSFTYDPELLLGGEEGEEQVELPPGPNNPVGLVWIGLSKEHYGIHGTDEPSTIGHSASSGCVRLTNWDARELATLVEAGMRVELRD